MHSPIGRVFDLTDPARNLLHGVSLDDARSAVAAGDISAVGRLSGQFAIVATHGQLVRMARSISRPLRFFIAKRAEGPCLVASDRIDRIHAWLREQGLADQFHPSYTRMVPAHHLMEVALVGCPDPSPRLGRFFDPPRGTLPADIDAIGDAYVGALLAETEAALRAIPPTEPVGVAFSGGVDSGSVFLAVYHSMLRLGMHPGRLKAFCLSVDADGADLRQARQFLSALGLDLFLEPVEVAPSAIDWRRAVRAVEDYKPLDIEAASMGLALGEAVRARYPDWKHLFDGDGGDENLKDYPIEANPELTIRSVLNNSMLYQEGWGVGAIKHSLTYSGGLSRSYTRTYAPADLAGFVTHSPYTSPRLIEVAEAIPFIQLTEWSHDRLYALKGEVVRAGIKRHLGVDMPVFEKRRFQHGVGSRETFARLFPTREAEYRRAYHAIYE